jgi:hypothetical protein
LWEPDRTADPVRPRTRTEHSVRFWASRLTRRTGPDPWSRPTDQKVGGNPSGSAKSCLRNPHSSTHTNRSPATSDTRGASRIRPMSVPWSPDVGLHPPPLVATRECRSCTSTSRLPLHEIAPISTTRYLPAAVAATAAAAQSFPPTLPIRSGCPAPRPDIRIGPGNPRTTGSPASDQNPSSRTWHLGSPDTWPARSNLGDVLQSLSLPFLLSRASPREKRGRCYAVGP